MMHEFRSLSVWTIFRAAAALTLTLLTASAVALAAPPADDDWMAAVAGGWAGEAGTTPMGPMPFVMLFDEQDDGSLHCRTALNQETYIELRFWKDDAGRWMLTESAGLEGEGCLLYTSDAADD